MRSTSLCTMCIALVTACVLSSPAAEAETVATFADPAPDESTPLFTLSNDTLSGGWDANGLNLIVPFVPTTYPDALFQMTDLTVLDGAGTLSGGTIEFFDADEEPILRIDFDAAQLLSPFGFGASEFVGHNVIFSGPIITSPLVDEAFSFSFANQVTTPAGFTWTAAFTSSAIPEPTALALLTLGGIVAAFPRRR